MDERFGKIYKLCSKKIIGELFEHKKTVKSYPIILHYFETELPEGSATFQITLSVPKRNFKYAHDRNRIKRLLRESIRKNKLILESFLTEENTQLALFLIYTSKEEISQEQFDKKIRQLFKAITHVNSNE